MNKNEHQSAENQHDSTFDNDQTTDNPDFVQDEMREPNTPETDNSACATDKMADETATDEEPAVDEAAEWKDKYMRLVAEYDNYRKRTMREKMELIETGGDDVVRQMLEVLDDMDRAMTAMETASDMEAVKQGIVLIDNKLRGALRARGLTEIEAVGQELDTNLHEAVARIEAAEEAQKGKIIDVVQKGYKLKERIIRYAKVVVGQ